MRILRVLVLVAAVFAVFVRDSSAQGCYICTQIDPPGGPIACGAPGPCNPGWKQCDIVCGGQGCICRAHGGICQNPVFAPVPEDGRTESGSRASFSDEAWAALNRAEANLAEVFSAVLGRTEVVAGPSAGIVSLHGRSYNFAAKTSLKEGSVALEVKLAKHPNWKRVRAEIFSDGHGQAEVLTKKGVTEALRW